MSNPITAAILRLTIVIALGAGTAPTQAAGRFLAVYASGKRLEGSEIRGWHDAQGEPMLDAQRLQQPGDRLLWLENRSTSAAFLPPAFVEFTTGDRLPGEVVGFRTGRENPERLLPPHFLVVPAVEVDLPGSTRQEPVPIVARWLRRVVWQRGEDDRYRPGTLRHRDGREVSFRSSRWTSGGVRLLLDQETRDVPFVEMAEVHLPSSNSWENWLEQMAFLAPACAGTIVQIETTGGLRLTGSLERFLVQSRDVSRPEMWFHGFQPAWSFDPLWLPYRTIRLRRFFEPHRPPLTLFEPSRETVRSSLAGGWSWRRDRSSRGLPLKCATEAYGWGVGVHAYSELTYDVPAFVREFRTQYGLDQAAGRGGSVRASVFAGTTQGTLLHRSPALIGSEKAYDSGPLAIPAAAGAQAKLTLVVDPMIDDAPPGADPFEVRDMFDWLQPILGLDLPSQQAEVRSRFSRVIPAWQDWMLSRSGPTETGSKQGPAMLSNTLDQSQPQLARFVSEIAPRETSLSLSRRLEIGRDHGFLLVAVARADKDPGSRIQVRIDGAVEAEFAVPPRKWPEPVPPLRFPVDRWRGKTIKVELVQMGETPIEWRAISLVPPPGAANSKVGDGIPGPPPVPARVAPP